MKKIIALFITLIYLSTNACLAFSELYYLKNVQTSNIQPYVTNALYDAEYRVKNQNPIYAVSNNNPEDYAVIILQQSGQNMFYFYESNKNKKINKNILKSIKRNDIEYEQSLNYNIISIYENLAQKTRTQGTQNYVFYDNNSSGYNVQSNQTIVQQPQVTSNSNSLKGYVAQIAKGTSIPIYLQNAINTATALKGDSITAVVTNNVNYNGQTVIPQGSMVYGTLTKARHATYGSRNGRVVIDFNKIVTPENKTYEISTEEIDFTVTNDGKAARVVGNAVVGAVVGGLLGLIVGAASGHTGASTAIGAGVGAGTAVISGTAERGVDAEIPSFTEMEIVLKKPVNVSISY